ncbi:hypothetical protein B0H13DRAFT_1883584 [Mycena leptocephala]|nr:hypothetical protein B0H13DRAFT_1883584 [Mycena leptocephala]
MASVGGEAGRTEEQRKTLAKRTMKRMGRESGEDGPAGAEGGVQEPPAVEGEKLVEGEGKRDSGDTAGAKEGGAQDPLTIEGQKLVEGEGERDGGDAVGAKEGGAQDLPAAKEHILQNPVEQECEQGGKKEAEKAGEERFTMWLKWMVNGHTLLKACPAGGSKESWATVVKTWVLLEEAYGFESSTAMLPSKPGMRPAEVGQWIKYSCSTTRATQVEDQDKLKDEAGRPTIGQETSDWGVLVHPGANSILTVLLPLVWWRLEEEVSIASYSWAAAMRDMSWVLQGLLSAAKTKKHKCVILQKLRLSQELGNAVGAKQPLPDWESGKGIQTPTDGLVGEECCSHQQLF